MRFVGAYTHDYQAAQDIVQEVFLRLHQEHLRHPNRTIRAGWLYTAARRLTIDQHRRRWPLPVASVPAAEANSRHELASEVGSVLDELPDLDRELLLLFYYQEWSTAQLATHYAISQDTVKSRLYRARARFRKKWTEEGIDHGS